MLVTKRRVTSPKKMVTVTNYKVDDVLLTSPPAGLIFLETSAKTYVFIHLIDFRAYTLLCSGENVEEAFLKTAKLIFQSVQDGRYALSHPKIHFVLASQFFTHHNITQCGC